MAKKARRTYSREAKVSSKHPCPRCGGRLSRPRNGDYSCESCGKTNIVAAYGPRTKEYF